MNSKQKQKALVLAVAAAILLVLLALYFYTGDPVQKDPLDAVRAYIEAIHARDFEKAYRHISSRDQKVRAKESYVADNRPYEGFTLELARSLVKGTEIDVLDREQTANRARLEVRFKVPAPADLAPLVHGWDSDKLNSLPPNRQKQLLETLEKQAKNGELVMVESRQTFDLVRDDEEWRLFFDWAAGLKVTFQVSSPSPQIEARLTDSEVITRIGEAFQTTLIIKNRGPREAVVRVEHLFEPRELAEHVYFIMCGFLRPVRIRPGSEREFTGAYVLDGETGEQVRRLAVTFEFKSDE